jgi:hypothetical protein
MLTRTLILVLGFLLFSLLGCTIEEKKQTEKIEEKNFGTSIVGGYTAIYKITDGKAEFEKKVWKKGNSLRVQYLIGEKPFFDIISNGSDTYTCTSWKEVPECFRVQAENISYSGQENNLSYLYEEKIDPYSVISTEETEIGNKKGICYTLLYSATSQKKVCLINGILAYREYYERNKKEYTEYLVSLKYGAESSIFIVKGIFFENSTKK